VHDVSNRRSYEHLRDWLREIAGGSKQSIAYVHCVRGRILSHAQGRTEHAGFVQGHADPHRGHQAGLGVPCMCLMSPVQDTQASSGALPTSTRRLSLCEEIAAPSITVVRPSLPYHTA
jgi:hypothetical protein